MSVFGNYNSSQAGGVNANAFPRVHPIPWTPTQRNVRANPGIPSQPQRIQPHERGTFFPTSASSDGTLAPQTAPGGGCGCGGGCSQSDPTPTASSVLTGHSFPFKGTSISADGVSKMQSRSVGAVRTLPRNPTTVQFGSTESMNVGAQLGRGR